MFLFIYRHITMVLQLIKSEGLRFHKSSCSQHIINYLWCFGPLPLPNEYLCITKYQCKSYGEIQAHNGNGKYLGQSQSQDARTE